MPGGDRTGPMGQGPMTGRKQGYCTGNEAGGYAIDPGFGMGRAFRNGIGGGKGRGRGNRFSPGYGFFWRSQFPTEPVDKITEIEQLKSRAEELKRSGEAIEKRIKELEKDAG